MTNKPLARAGILKQLAQQLDDAVLERIFPGQRPDDIRRIIAGDKPDAGRPAVVQGPADAVAAPSQGGAVSRCRLFTDGASRGNPGQAGAGAVLLTDDGRELATCSVYLGTCTNNVAEYKALLIGLDEVLRQGCCEVAVSLDSELIVRQIQGRYKVKNEVLLPLFQQVQARLARMKTWSIAHVPRAQNARADQLANQGIDQKDG